MNPLAVEFHPSPASRAPAHDRPRSRYARFEPTVSASDPPTMRSPGFVPSGRHEARRRGLRPAYGQHHAIEWVSTIVSTTTIGEVAIQSGGRPRAVFPGWDSPGIRVPMPPASRIPSRTPRQERYVAIARRQIAAGFRDTDDLSCRTGKFRQRKASSYTAPGTKRSCPCWPIRTRRGKRRSVGWADTVMSGFWAGVVTSIIQNLINVRTTLNLRALPRAHHARRIFYPGARCVSSPRDVRRACQAFCASLASYPHRASTRAGDPERCPRARGWCRC